MDARPVLLVLTVAVAAWNPSSAAAQSWTGNNTPPPAPNFDRYAQPPAPSQGFNTASGRATSSPFTAPANSSPPSSSARGSVSSPWTNTTGAATSAPSWTSNPTGTAPATTTRTAAPSATAVDGGWTSIGTSVAAPPLLITPLPTTTSSFNNATTTSNVRSTASFPNTASNDPQSLHSVLSDPARPAAPTTTSAADNWATGWGDNSTSTTATIGRGSGSSSTATVRDSGLTPLQPPPAAATSPNTAGTTGTRYNDGWPDTNNWTQPTQPTLGSANGATSATTRPGGTSSSSNGTPASIPSQPSGQLAGQSGIQPTGGQTIGNFNSAGSTPSTNVNAAASNLPQIGRNAAVASTATEPQAWMPLILTVLGLAGSLAANLYLGVSYLDARQKYQSLVRKTADTFRRVKAAAA